MVGVGCCRQLDGQFVRLPPASSFLPFFLPPSLVLLLLSVLEHKQSNTSTAAHISSVLQLSAPCLHTEGFDWADWAHTKHKHTRSHTARASSTAASKTQQQLIFFLVFDTKHLSFCLFLSLSRRLLLSSSCQVDISFISQEVFDRPFYEEMYPPAAPIATAQLQYIFPSRTDSHRGFNFHPFFSLHHSGPFHFTFLSFCFVVFLLFLIKISSNVWSSTWKRDYLYILYQVCDRLCFFFVCFCFVFFVPEMGEIILKARGERGLFFLKISDFSKECFYNLTHNSTLIHLTDSRAFNFLGGFTFFFFDKREGWEVNPRAEMWISLCPLAKKCCIDFSSFKLPYFFLFFFLFLQLLSSDSME